MVSSQRGKRQPGIQSRFDEEPMSLDSLIAARQLFTNLAMRMPLDSASKSDSAGPRLHRCDGSALTAQESGPAISEREQDDEHGQPVSTA